MSLITLTSKDCELPSKHSNFKANCHPGFTLCPGDQIALASCYLNKKRELQVKQNMGIAIQISWWTTPVVGNIDVANYSDPNLLADLLQTAVNQVTGLVFTVTFSRLNNFFNFSWTNTLNESFTFTFLNGLDTVLGFAQSAYSFPSNSTYSFQSELSPQSSEDDTTYMIHLDDLPMRSYNCYGQGSRSHAIFAVPCQTSNSTSIISLNAPVMLYIDLNLTACQTYENLNVSIRTPSGIEVDDLGSYSTIQVYIKKKEGHKCGDR